MNGNDPLANQAVSIISSLIRAAKPFIEKKYREKIAETLSEKTNKLFSVIKRKFDGNEDDKLDLENIQIKPERYSGQIAEILKGKVKDDNAFASDIDDAIKEIQELNVDDSIEDSEAKEHNRYREQQGQGQFFRQLSRFLLLKRTWLVASLIYDLK